MVALPNSSVPLRHYRRRLSPSPITVSRPRNGFPERFGGLGSIKPSTKISIKCNVLGKTDNNGGVEASNCIKDEQFVRFFREAWPYFLIDDFQILKNELLIITKERDKLMAQIEEQQSPEVEVDLCGENYDDNLLKAKAEMEELTGRLSRLEAKMRSNQDWLMVWAVMWMLFNMIKFRKPCTT